MDSITINKKKIWYFSLMFILFIGSLSCSTQKIITDKQQQKYTEDSIYNVILTIKRKVPYCGGAAPSPEVMKRTIPEINTNFLLSYQQGYGDSLWIKEFMTDSTGKIRLNLPDGKYCLKRAGKKIPFDDFYKMHKKENDNFNLYGNINCYYKWWKSCNYIFEINDESNIKEIEVIIISQCFTGENPCHKYIGPYPP